MATVNPPPIPRMPPEWFSNPNIKAYQEAIGRILLQLYIRTGSGTDLFDTLQDQITSNDADIATNASNISTNATDIATNTTNISTNTTNIATNTANIAINAAAITALTPNIGARIEHRA